MRRSSEKCGASTAIISALGVTSNGVCAAYFLHRKEEGVNGRCTPETASQIGDLGVRPSAVSV